MIDEIKDMFERAEVSKGQFLSILVIITLLFISGGSMFTTLFARQQLGYVFTYFEGDMRQVAETQMKSETFPDYLDQQAEYSINNAAYVLGQNGSNEEWTKSSIPSQELMREHFNETIVAHPTYGLRTKDFIYGCSTPSVAYYNVEDNPYMSSEKRFVYNVNHKTIACGNSDTKGIQTVDISSSIVPEDSVVNIQHNYADMTRYARELAQELDETVPDAPIYDTGSATTACDPTSDMRQTQREEGHKNARENAVDIIDGLADVAVSNTDKPDYLEVETSDSASWWPRVDDPNNETDIPCDITITHDNSSCYSEDCGGTLIGGDYYQHTHSDYRGADNDDCDEYDCMSHTHDHEQDPSELIKKEYDYNVTLATFYATINMTDVDNSVITYDGSTNLPFDYDYTHPLTTSSPY